MMDDDWDDARAQHGQSTSNHGVERAANAHVGATVTPQSKRLGVVATTGADYFLNLAGRLIENI